jgi:hypothetical protein
MSEQSSKTTDYLVTRGLVGENRQELKKGETIHLSGGESGLANVLYSRRLVTYEDGTKVLWGKTFFLPSHRKVNTITNGEVKVGGSIAPRILGGMDHYIKAEAA